MPECEHRTEQPADQARQTVGKGNDQNHRQPREQADARNSRRHQEAGKIAIERDEVDLIEDVWNGFERFSGKQPDRPLLRLTATPPLSSW
jgi:hypothetical protein